jgi:mannose-6-phosphate isomerase-like protein (cupin superfamily)
MATVLGGHMKPILVVAMAAAIPYYSPAQTKAEVFPGSAVSSQLTALIQAADGAGSGGATLGDYKSHAIKLSVRTQSGGAEAHAHYDDIFVVTDGSATLVTGGNIVDAKTDSSGETKGISIQNGKSEIIAKGAVVHIPAGVPHQLILVPGSVYSSIVIKVRELPEQH